MNERFSLAKFLDFSPMAFTKVIGLSLKLCVLILIVMGVLWIKNLLFPTGASVKDINVKSGGQVIINESKRRIEFFIGPFVSTDKDGDWRIGTFGGIKW